MERGRRLAGRRASSLSADGRTGLTAPAMGKATAQAQGGDEAEDAPTAQADTADQVSGGTVAVGMGRPLFRIEPTNMFDIVHRTQCKVLGRASSVRCNTQARGSLTKVRSRVPFCAPHADTLLALTGP
jgi:hypothetical protein